MTQPIEIWEREIGEFKIAIEIFPDEDVDLSYIGDYSDEWREGAIDRFQGIPNLYPRELRYFVPAFCTDGERRVNRQSAYDRGQSKHEAYQEGESQRFYLYDQMRKIERGDLFFVGVVATVSRNGVELGSDSVWGVEVERVSEDSLYYESSDMVCCALDSAVRQLHDLKSEYASKLSRIHHLLVIVLEKYFQRVRLDSKIYRWRRYVEFKGIIPTKESVNV